MGNSWGFTPPARTSSRSQLHVPREIHKRAGELGAQPAACVTRRNQNIPEKEHRPEGRIMPLEVFGDASGSPHACERSCTTAGNSAVDTVGAAAPEVARGTGRHRGQPLCLQGCIEGRDERAGKATGQIWHMRARAPDVSANRIEDDAEVPALKWNHVKAKSHVIEEPVAARPLRGGKRTPRRWCECPTSAGEGTCGSCQRDAVGGNVGRPSGGSQTVIARDGQESRRASSCGIAENSEQTGGDRARQARAGVDHGGNATLQKGERQVA